MSPVLGMLLVTAILGHVPVDDHEREDTEHLAGVVTLEAQIQLLSRRLGFDDEGTDAR